ncbi:MAG: molybdopterin-dependent oxidoreductase [Anaerolineales bacterium]|nr:molybdopterin-dependent oxidoreductase [Anaerolineales bacterium]MCB8965912.1 molybdopterin-dependent oxidoreductase [Ardenticatenaceae bacterium]
MKKIIVVLMVFTVLLVGCAAGETETAVNSSLIVGDKTYSVADLEALPVSEAVFKDVTYNGVTLTALLENAGFTLADLKAVKAVAADGYTVNYDLSQIEKPDVLVAYAQADGPLTEEDGAFRMVLPEEEGKLNVRMLVEIQVVQ